MLEVVSQKQREKNYCAPRQRVYMPQGIRIFLTFEKKSMLERYSKNNDSPNGGQHSVMAKTM